MKIEPLNVTINELFDGYEDRGDEGRQAVLENCQMLCRPCNRRKGAK